MRDRIEADIELQRERFERDLRKSGSKYFIAKISLKRKRFAISSLFYDQQENQKISKLCRKTSKKSKQTFSSSPSLKNLVDDKAVTKLFYKITFLER